MPSTSSDKDFPDIAVESLLPGISLRAPDTHLSLDCRQHGGQGTPPSHFYFTCIQQKNESENSNRIPIRPRSNSVVSNLIYLLDTTFCRISHTEIKALSKPSSALRVP